MISIPKNLQDKNFRFILINPKNKIPLEKAWQNENNYEFNSPKLLNHLANEGNYGILTGDGLIVIDADEDIIENIVINNLPKTFTVKTGSGGKHFYFKSKINKKIIFFDYVNLENGKPKHLGELQAKGQQVVGPTSIHPNGNSYEIIEDISISDISEELIDEYFNEFIKKEKSKEKIKENNNEISLPVDEQEIIDKLDLKSHLDMLGFDTSHNPTKCVWHEMNGAGNFSFDNSKHVWNCFHCGRGGNIIHLYMNFFSISKYEAKKRLREELNTETLSFSNRVLGLIHTNRREATELLVERILKKYKIFSTREDKYSEMWIYIEGIYVPQAKTHIEEFCRNILRESYKKAIANEVIDKIQAETYIEQEELFQNEDLNLIPVRNGIYNLATGQLEEFNSNYRFFTKINVDFDSNKECLKIKKFFKEILQSEEDVKVMQEIFGFLLYRDYSPEKAIMFNGSGRNGKSKTLDLMKRFIGADNCTNLSLEEIENNNFAISNLFNKMANLSGDLSKTVLNNTGKFKSLTGRDLMSGDRKFLPRVDFTNYAKMIFSANELPLTQDLTEAFFNRWVLIDFPYTFLSQKELNNLDEVKKNKCKLADMNIINEITTNDEMSGLFNWAIEGLSCLRNQGDFSKSTSIDEVRKEWLRKSSSLNGFIMDCIIEDYSGIILKKDFRKEYTLYCRKHKLRPVSDRIIKYVLTTNLGVEDAQNTNGYCWVGIKLKK